MTIYETSIPKSMLSVVLVQRLLMKIYVPSGSELCLSPSLYLILCNLFFIFNPDLFLKRLHVVSSSSISLVSGFRSLCLSLRYNISLSSNT